MNYIRNMGWLVGFQLRNCWPEIKAFHFLFFTSLFLCILLLFFLSFSRNVTLPDYIRCGLILGDHNVCMGHLSRVTYAKYSAQRYLYISAVHLNNTKQIMHETESTHMLNLDITNKQRPPPDENNIFTFSWIFSFGCSYRNQ